MNQRLSDFVLHFEEKARQAIRETQSARETKVLHEIFSNLRHLFTHAVTAEGVRNLFRREARDTLRFYTSQIDFEELRRLPPAKRIPLTAWRIFTATAYRLSPPRRLAFAVGFVSLILGAFQFLVSTTQPDAAVTGIIWWLLTISIFVLLLLMELRDKLDLKSDLEIAREIQLALVPSGPYRNNTIWIHSQMRTANTVGGDYDDIIDLGDNRIGIVMGDVAGKGMPAALLMALLQGSLRTLLTAGLRGTELIRRLNEYLCDNIPNNRLVTLFYGELDTVTGSLCYVNAGHNAPFHLRSGAVAARLAATSVVLGVLRDAAFEARETVLQPEDRLLLFTDGLSEAFNQGEEEYGEQRLEDFLTKNASRAQDELIARLIEDVLTYCDSARPGDDMTLMSIERRT